MKRHWLRFLPEVGTIEGTAQDIEETHARIAKFQAALVEYERLAVTDAIEAGYTIAEIADAVKAAQAAT